jgi:hypothetical protein
MQVGVVIKKMGRRALIFVGWLMASMLIISLTLVLLVQTSWGNDQIRKLATSWLAKKLQTELSIGKLEIRGLNDISVFRLSLRDQKRDTLLYMDTLHVSVRLSGIFGRKILIPQIRIAGLHSELKREKGSSEFNYQFLIDAFSPGKKDDEKEPGKPWDLQFRDVTLGRTFFLWDDQHAGNYCRVQLKELDLPLDKTDLSASYFKAGKILINGLDAEMQIRDSEAEAEKSNEADTGSPSMAIEAADIILNNTGIGFSNQDAGLTIKSAAKTLSLNGVSYNLATGQAGGGTLVLHDHSTTVQYRPAGKEKASKPVPDSGKTQSPFSLSLDSISIERNALAIENNAVPKRSSAQFDAAHLDLRDLFIKASAIRYDINGYAAKIRLLSFRDANGFELRRAQANARYSDTALALEGLLIETKKNRLEGSVNMTYASISKLVSAPKQTRVNVQLNDGIIRLDEIYYFAPSMAGNQQLSALAKKDIRLQMRSRGTLDQLTLDNYRVQVEGNLIRGSAKIAHITEPRKVQAQINLAELTSGKKDLRSLFPSGVIPDSAWNYIPENLTVRGTLSASRQRIEPNLSLQTSFGNLDIKGFVNQPTDKQNARYNLGLQTPGFALGQILGDTAMGDFAGSIALSGTGLDPETLTANVNAVLEEAMFKGHKYAGIKVHGSMNHGDILADIESSAPELNLDADIAFHYGKNISNIDVRADVRRLDLQQLGLADSVFAFRGKADIHFPTLDSSRLEGNALISSLSLSLGEKEFLLDTVRLDAHVSMDSQYVELSSPLADLELKGKFSLRSIPEAAKVILDNWLVTEGALRVFPEPLYAEFKANVHIPDSLAAIIPGLKSVEPFTAFGGIDTRNNSLLLLTVLPKVEYSDYSADSVMILLMQVDTIARYKQSRFVVQVKSLKGKSFGLNKSIIGGQINKGVINSTLVFFDAKNEIRYRLPVVFNNDPVRPYISIPDSVMLNGKHWEVNRDNRIYTSPDRLQGSSLVLSFGEESISLKAEEQRQSGLPLVLDLKNLQLETLTSMVIGQTKLLTGTANGNARVSSIKPFAFTTDLRLDSLHFIGSALGNLHAKAKTEEDGDYIIDLALKGEGNDVMVAGQLNPAKGNINLNTRLSPLNLQPFAPFLANYLDSVRGSLAGNLTVQGNMKKPLINGQLALGESYMILKMTGTPLFIPEAGLDFSGQDIRFRGMRLLDSAGRPAIISGTGKAENLTNISYDLRIQSQKFLLSGRKRYEEQLVSGPLYAGMLLNIRGNLEHADITGNLDIIDSSQLTYVYHPDINKANGDGLIEFFDPVKKDSTDSLLVLKNTPRKTGFRLSVSSYIKITPTSSVTIVLDELSGDQLTAKGTANLNFSMEPGGETEMTGSYMVESGSYNLTIGGILKKTFELQKGSTITWSGDLLKAKTDLTALYRVRTDAEELLQEVESVPGAGKQKFDFEVYMMIKDELLKPSISFRLDMAPKEQSAFNGTVYTRIRQVNSVPSELNKQVMGLLAINSFIADNPFNSLTGGGGNIETQAFSTAGRLLTQELNDFLGSVIKDVDIDIGLDIRDDYTSGEAKRRSDLKVGFTKSFAKNRLSIYVGNTFALEHPNQNTNAMSGLAGDVSIEYLLTSDGKYRLKGYRITEENLTFNGIVVETGLSFVVVLEFNRFRNAFRSGNKKRKFAS